MLEEVGVVQAVGGQQVVEDRGEGPASLSTIRECRLRGRQLIEPLAERRRHVRGSVEPLRDHASVVGGLAVGVHLAQCPPDRGIE